MYTLIDLNYIKRDSDGLLITKNSPEYQEYVDYYSAGSPVVAVDNGVQFELFEGQYKGKTAGFLRLKETGKLKRTAFLDTNKKRRRGLLINKLCNSVIEYITGKNDGEGKTSAEIDAFLVAHGAILVPLQQNRHNTAKGLIDAITPDSHVSQSDLDNIQDIYDAYLPEINSIV